PPHQTHPAHCACLHLSVDYKLPDRQEAAWEKLHPAPGQSSLVPLRDACSPHCSSPSTPTTAPQETRLIKLLKFSDDTTVIGLIRDEDESAYRREVEQLALWCGRNNLELNTLKIVEMI